MKNRKINKRHILLSTLIPTSVLITTVGATMSTLVSCNKTNNDVVFGPNIKIDGVSIKSSNIVKGKDSSIEFNLPEGKSIDDITLLIGNIGVKKSELSIEDNKVTIPGNKMVDNRVTLVSLSLKTISPGIIKVNSITINNGQAVSLKVGATANLSLQVLPENATDKSVTWSSDSPNVTVDQTGKIVAKAVTSDTPAKIIATAKDGSGVKGTCFVTVEAAAQYVFHINDNGYVSLNKNFAEQWTYTDPIVIPEEIDGKTVKGIANLGFSYYDGQKGWVVPQATSIVFEKPENITFIGEYSLCLCAFESFDIPETVTSIGEAAFEGCDKLKKIVIPQGVSVVSDSVFNVCSSLEDVTIPDGVTIINRSAFHGCSKLKQIKLPAALQTIASAAFQSSGLTQITIPSTVTKIEYGAFTLSDIASVTFDNTKNWKQTEGSSIDVSKPADNATNLKDKSGELAEGKNWGKTGIEVSSAKIGYDNVTNAGWQVPTTDPKVNPQSIKDATNPFNVYFENTKSELANKYFKISIVSANDESKIFGWKIAQATTQDAKAVIETSITTTTDLEGAIVIKLEEHSLDYDITEENYRGVFTHYVNIGKVSDGTKIKLTLKCIEENGADIQSLFVQNTSGYTALKLYTDSVTVETNKEKQIYFEVASRYGVGHDIKFYSDAEHSNIYKMENGEKIILYLTVNQECDSCQFSISAN